MDPQLDSLILDAMSTLTVVLDCEGRIVRFNRAAEEAIGFSRDQVLGRSFVEMLPDSEELEVARARFERFVAGHAPMQTEYWSRTRDGRRLHIRWSAAPARDESGAVQYIVCTGTIMSERSAAEELLRRSDTLHRRTMEAVPGGIVRVGQDGAILTANAEAERTLGLQFNEKSRTYVADFRNKTIREDGSDYPVEDYPVSRCLRTGQPQPPAVIGVVRPDGKIFWGVFTAIPMTEPQTNLPDGAVVTFLDITQRKEAEEALRASEERFRAAFANAAVGVTMGNLEGRYFQVNAAYCAITGYEEKELIGRHFLDITHPDDRQASESWRETLLSGQVPTIVSEKRYFTKAGQTVWVQVSISLARDAQGHPAHFIALVENITQRRRAQEALRDSEERFRQLAETMDGVFWLFDSVHGRCLYVNPAYERVWGRSRQSLYENPYSFLEPVVPEDLPRIQEDVKRTEPHVQEYRLRKPDGSIIWVHNSVFPVRDEQGRIYRMCGIAQDVTERKRTEQAIHAMNEHLEQLVAERTAASQEQSRILRSVLQSMGEAVIVADRDGNVILTNPAAARIAGQCRSEPHKVEECATPGRFFRGDGVTEYLPRELPLARAVCGEEVGEEEMLIYKGDAAQETWISTNAMPLRDESGALAGGVLVARDTSERRRVEQLLRDSERHYRDLAERNRLLVREVDHRVRNNIAALLGLVAVMQDRVQDVKSFAAAMDSRLRAMAHVHQLLARTEWQPLELRVLVESTLGSMQAVAPCAAQVLAQGPLVKVRPRQVLPLTLILVEWLTNSCKYGVHSAPGGRLEVRWELLRTDDTRQVRLTWQERGGPPVHRPVSASLGTELVHALAARELAGRCDMRFENEGATHVIEFAASEDGDAPKR